MVAGFSKHRLKPLLVACALLGLASGHAQAGGHDVMPTGPRIIVENPGQNLSYLTEEQKDIAADMTAFVERMRQKIEDGVGAPYSERQEFPLEYGNYLVEVARGKAIAKAGLYTGHSTLGSPPRIRDTYWNSYLQVDVHPSSPYVGLAHITMTLQFITDGKTVVGGNVHMGRSAMKKEDIEYIKVKVDEVFDKHGVDIAPYRKARCKGFRLEHDLTVCSGVSFYVPPLMEANRQNYELVRDTWEAFLDASIALANKRVDEPYTQKEKDKQDKMRWWWLQDRLFSDDFTTSVVPFELFFMATLPPDVKF